MKPTFELSDGILDEEEGYDTGYLDVQDVKKFIKHLKEWINHHSVYKKDILEEIDRLAGDKLK